jgi:citrate synthase
MKVIVPGYSHASLKNPNPRAESLNIFFSEFFNPKLETWDSKLL